jgi:hypothetical protein
MLGNDDLNPSFLGRIILVQWLLVPKIVGLLDDVHIRDVIIHGLKIVRVDRGAFQQNDPSGASKDNPTKETTNRHRFLPCILQQKTDPVVDEEEDGRRVDDSSVLDTTIEIANIVAKQNTFLGPDIPLCDNTKLENESSLPRLLQILWLFCLSSL